MPMEVVGQRQRIEKTRMIMELCERVNKHPTGDWNPDPWLVHNPAPNRFKTGWADPKKVQKKVRKYGARVVSAERGKKFYQLDDDEIDKGKNCCMRLGSVLIEYDKDVYEAKLASMTLLSMQGVNRDIQKFMSSESSAIDLKTMRAVRENPELMRQMSHEVRSGKRSAANMNQLNDQRREVRVQDDIRALIRDEIRKALAGNSDDMSPDEAQELLDSSQGIEREDGVRTVNVPTFLDEDTDSHGSQKGDEE